MISLILILPFIFHNVVAGVVVGWEIPLIVSLSIMQVGVLIGKAGETIRTLQTNSGARIQITRDAEADPNSSTRPVELTGTLESINKAEQLIKDVIAEVEGFRQACLPIIASFDFFNIFNTSVSVWSYVRYAHAISYCIFFLQADAGGSPALVARGFGAAYSGSEGHEMQVPNEKVNHVCLLPFSRPSLPPNPHHCTYYNNNDNN